MQKICQKLLGFSFLVFLMVCYSACDEDVDIIGALKITEIKIGDISLLGGNAIVPENASEVIIAFNKTVDPSTLNNIGITRIDNGQNVIFTMSADATGSILQLKSNEAFSFNKEYELGFAKGVKSISGDTLSAQSFRFMVANDPLLVDSILLNGKILPENLRTEGTGTQLIFDLYLNYNVPAEMVQANVSLSRTGSSIPLSVNALGNGHYQIKLLSSVEEFREYRFRILDGLGTAFQKAFAAKEFVIYTSFKQLTDDELLTLVQRQTFRYFWDFGHPVSGMARERNNSGDVVTTGGSGFGLMATIVAVERGFISRQDALDRWDVMISFLRNADRFHGVWGHWMNGASGKVFPFSQKDNGADLVETAFMIQAMYTLRQYLQPSVPREANLINRINFLIDAVEWSWFTRGGQNVLYWHWSPNFAWDLNLPLRGYNETLIAYVLAASSKTSTISKEAYKQGYARNGAMRNGNTYYGYKLPLGSARGGPLFFTHYSFLGLDPRKLKDTYADYWEQNVNHSLINRAYCIANPLRYNGYGENNWGLTACDGNNGYNAFSPENDRGVIAPTAALSSFPYTPEESMKALKNYYYVKGDRLWGPHGFYDAFNDHVGWVANSYLAIDQGPIICMIENHRTGLLWNLFMSAPEIKEGLTKLGFSYE